MWKRGTQLLLVSQWWGEPRGVELLQLGGWGSVRTELEASDHDILTRYAATPLPQFPGSWTNGKVGVYDLDRG